MTCMCEARRQAGYAGKCPACQAADAAEAREAERRETRERERHAARNAARYQALTNGHAGRDAALTYDESLAVYRLWVDAGRTTLPATDDHVLDLAERLGRKPATIAFRLSNLTHLQTAGREGLDHYGENLLRVWEERERGLAVAS